MFGPKEKQESTSTRLAQVNLIGEGTTVHGEILAQGDLRVAGTICGDVSCKGRIVVTVSGVIEGIVKAQEADVAGKVTGDIYLERKLVLREGGRLTGDAHVKVLAIEEGAHFDGRCIMVEATHALKVMELPS